MAISTNNHLSATQAAQFFRAPETTRQRQYEALRAYYVDNQTAPVVARQFGYSPAALRSLCHLFRHAPVPATLPHGTASANWPSPCAKRISPSTTSNANWQRPVIPSASTP